MAAAEELVRQLPAGRLKVAPFSQWTYADAKGAIKTMLPKNYTQRRLYAEENDHLQNGKEWVGPGDPRSNDKIGEQFAPDDAAGEALWNVSNAFREAQLGFAPIEDYAPGTELPEELKRKIEEAKAAISDWWDKRRLHEMTQNRLYTSAWAGFAGMRPWIPQRFLQRTADGTVMVRNASDPVKALDFIYLDGPAPRNGAIYTHPQTQDKVAIFLGSEVEMVNGHPDEVRFAELVYLDPDRDDDTDAETIMRVVYEDGRRGYEARLDLGGRLLFAQMSTRALFTDPVLRGQRQLNFLCSLLTRMAETAAFRERYTQNARPQGMRIPYEDGDILPQDAFLDPDDEGRIWIVIPEPRTLGANTTTELVGLPRYNTEGGSAGYETPGITVVEPVDPTPYVNAAESVRRRVLRMCSQGHLSGTSNFEVSGIAYEQARAVFEKDLNSRRVAEEGMLRDLIGNVLALAEHISGQQGYFTDVLRVVINQHVDAGPRSPDTVRLDHEAYEKGLLSKATAMSRIGVEDLESEELMIQYSAEHILSVLDRVMAYGNLKAESMRELLTLLKLPADFISTIEDPEPVEVPIVPGDGG